MNGFDLGSAKPVEAAPAEPAPSEVKTETGGFDLATAKPAGIPSDITNGNPPADDSFLGTLKNPWKLWTEESIGAHLYNAYKEGTFDKPLGEIVKSGKELVSETAKNFKMSDLIDAVKSHPGKMAGEFVNTVVADPELLLPMFWEGLGGRLGVAGLRIAGKAGQAAGRAAEIGGTLGAVGGVESAAKQLDEAGFIDPAKLSRDMGTSAAFGAALGGVFSVGGLMLKSKPRDIAAIAQEKMAEGANPLRATEEALRESGMSGKKARELTDALEPYRDENALEAAAAKERIASGEAPAVGAEPSALAAREQFLDAKRSLTPSQARDLADIKHYREILPELDVEPQVADAMTPKEARAIIEERVPNAPLETFVKAEAPKVLEEAPIAVRPETPPSKPPNTTEKNFANFLESVGKRQVMEAHGQDILDNMTESALSPQTVANQFWEDTYFKLPGAVQERFQRMLKSHTGMEPGAATGKNRTTGEVTRAEHWQDVAKEVDLAHSADELEGTDRGFVALMKDANDRVGSAAVPQRMGQLSPGWKERGFLDPTLAKYAGITLTGAAIGGYLADDKAKGAALGAALFLGGPLALKAASRISEHGVEAIKASSIGRKVGAVLEKRNPEITARVDAILSRHEGTIAEGKLNADRHTYAIKKLVPDAARREEILHATQAGRALDLTGNELAAAQIHAKMAADLGDWGLKKGVLDRLIEDGTHVAQLWEDGPKAQSLFASMAGKSRFAEERVIPNVKMGEELGLVAKTKDIADVDNIYMNSIAKAAANKDLLHDITHEVFADGRRAVVEPGEWASMTPKERAAYSDFVPVNHPQLFGAKVHPELAPSLGHFFHSTEIPAYVRAAAAISAVAKRGIFMLSGFHVKSLADEALGVSLGLLDKNSITKIPSMYKMIKEGKAGDFASQMVKDGLKIEPHAGVDMDNDIFRSIAKSAEALARDLPIPGAHLPIKALTELDKGIQFATWEYFHPAVKMSVASSMMEKALLSGDNRAPQVIRREIAGVVNDLFGGINWRQTADGVENKLLSSIVHSLTSPNGLRILRILMTAPDWTVATARAGLKGTGATLKKVTGQKLSHPEQMYMRAFLGNAVAYATIAEGLNLAFSGHHFWQNKDPTYVDMGDGRKLQLNKHFMEPIHDLMDPANAIVNKAGYLPKEITEQLFGKEYLTAKRSEKGRTWVGPEMKNPSIPGRIAHAVRGMVPIPLQQSDIGPAISGSLGLPIYGKTDRQKRMDKRQQEVDQRQRARERELTKRREKRR